MKIKPQVQKLTNLLRVSHRIIGIEVLLQSSLKEISIVYLVRQVIMSQKRVPV